MFNEQSLLCCEAMQGNLRDSLGNCVRRSPRDGLALAGLGRLGAGRSIGWDRLVLRLVALDELPYLIVGPDEVVICWLVEQLPASTGSQTALWSSATLL
jgi:hypothetical protein